MGWRPAMTKLFHGTLTRRHFLGTSAAALAASALPSAAPAQGARFRRFEISDPGMPPRVLDSYKKGIREMLNRPPTDPRNWYRNAFIHAFPCPHQKWWFLAWHRAYIGWLEATIREFSSDPEFALPYWDWTKTPRVPAAMFDDVLDPNNAAFIPTFDAFKAQFDAPVTALFAAFSQAQQDVLAQRGLSSTADFWSAVAAAPPGMFFEQPGARGLTPVSPDLDRTTRATVAAATIRSALRTANFAGSASGTDAAGFASAQAASHNDQSREGILESQPHDNVHGAMGGAAGTGLHGALPSPGGPPLFPAPRHPRPVVGRGDPQANRARTPDAAARRGCHGVVERAFPVLQRSERPAGVEDQRGRLRRDERLRLRLFAGLGRGSGPGARDARRGIVGDAGFQRADHVGDDRRRRRGGPRGDGAGGPARPCRPAGTAARCRGHLEPRARRPGPPLPRPGLTAGRGQPDRSGRHHHLQPSRPWSHHVHRSASGKSPRGRGRPWG